MKATKEMLYEYIKVLLGPDGYLIAPDVIDKGSKAIRKDLETLSERKDNEIARKLKDIDEKFEKERAHLSKLLPILEAYEQAHEELVQQAEDRVKGLQDKGYDLQQISDFLCDGEALKREGYTDADIALVTEMQRAVGRERRALERMK